MVASTPQSSTGGHRVTRAKIALGAKLLASTGHAIGDQVVVDLRGRERKYDIVGTTLLPGLGEAQPLAGGALFTVGGIERIVPERTRSDDIDNYVVVRLDPNGDQAALLRRLQETHADLEPIAATVPAEIERLRQIDAFPALLAGLTVVIAGIALGYTLVVSVRRRRRELAILRTVGFTRRASTRRGRVAGHDARGHRTGPRDRRGLHRRRARVARGGG